MKPTYKMIGGDGREYGPVPLDDLRSWVLEGRVVGTTLIWSDDSQDWQEAAVVDGLREEFERLAVSRVSPAVRTELVLASPWSRTAAFLLDTILLWALADFLWPTVSAWLGLELKPLTPPNTLQDWAKSAQDNLPRAMFLQCCRMVIEVWMTGRFGATPGKLIAGLRVVAQDGSPVGYPRALLRFFSRLMSEIPLYGGYLPAFFRKDRKGLHDLLAGTQVVSVTAKEPLDRTA